MKEKIIALKEERVVVWALLWVILALFILYVYFMNETVFNVAKRVHAEQEFASLNSKMSELEFENISMRNNIDIDLAYALGFKDIKNPRYISQTPYTAQAIGNPIQ